MSVLDLMRSRYSLRAFANRPVPRDTLLAVLPVVVYLQAEFLPGVGRAWAAAVPLLALHHVATGG